MAITVASLVPEATLGASSGTIYTTPANTHAKVGLATFTNISGAAVSFSVSITRSGGSGVSLILSQSLSINQCYVSGELAGLVLNPGDLITAQATAGGAVAAVLSGFTF